MNESVTTFDPVANSLYTVVLTESREYISVFLFADKKSCCEWFSRDSLFWNKMASNKE